MNRSVLTAVIALFVIAASALFVFHWHRPLPVVVATDLPAAVGEQAAAQILQLVGSGGRVVLVVAQGASGPADQAQHQAFLKAFATATGRSVAALEAVRVLAEDAVVPAAEYQELVNRQSDADGLVLLTGAPEVADYRYDGVRPKVLAVALVNPTGVATLLHRRVLDAAIIPLASAAAPVAVEPATAAERFHRSYQIVTVEKVDAAMQQAW